MDLDLDKEFSLLIASLNLHSSWYVRALVNNEPAVLVVDSGAGVTMLDISLLETFHLSKNNLVKDQQVYRSVDGRIFDSLGKAEVTLRIGAVYTKWTVVFADLKSGCGLLGMDFLEKHECVFYLSSGSLNVLGHDVPLHKPEPYRGCRVSLVEAVQIQPRTYAMVPGRLDKPWDKCPVGVASWLQPSTFLAGTDGENGIRVIPGVIDPSIGTVSVLLINSSDRPYKLKGDTLLGIACPTFCDSVSTTPKSAPEPPEYHNDGECGVLPEHLSHLLDSVNGLTEMETVKVRL